MGFNVNICGLQMVFGFTPENAKAHIKSEIEEFLDKAQVIRNFLNGEGVNIEINITGAGHFCTDGKIITASIAEIQNKTNNEEAMKDLVESILFEIMNTIAFDKQKELDKNFYAGKNTIHKYGKAKASIEMESSLALKKMVKNRIGYKCSPFAEIHITNIGTLSDDDYIKQSINLPHNSKALDHLKMASWKVYAFEGAGYLMKDSYIKNYFKLMHRNPKSNQTMQFQYHDVYLKIPFANRPSTKGKSVVNVLKFYAFSNALKNLANSWQSSSGKKLQIEHNGQLITDWTEHLLDTDMVNYVAGNKDELITIYEDAIKKIMI